MYIHITAMLSLGIGVLTTSNVANVASLPNVRGKTRFSKRCDHTSVNLYFITVLGAFTLSFEKFNFLRCAKQHGCVGYSASFTSLAFMALTHFKS